MKKKEYRIINSIEKILSGNNTLFLDMSEYKLLISKLKKGTYNIFYSYPDCERVILYSESIPEITLYKINCNESLRHQDILGSIMSLNILSSYVGDIIIDGDNYYFYVISKIKKIIKDNLLMIGNKKITLEELPSNYLSNYKRAYEDIEIIASSTRIDNIISKIINTNRKEIEYKIKNKEIILNYDVLSKTSYLLKENDIFSIKRYGKYKYIGIINTTKSNNLVIKCLKYI